MGSLRVSRKLTTFFIKVQRAAFLIALLVTTLQGVVPQVAAQAPAAPVAPAATTNTIVLSVLSARDNGQGITKGQAATTYKWIINADNVGDPTTQTRLPVDDPTNPCDASNPSYPAGCNWPSIRPVNGFAPIVTQGDQTDLNSTTGLALPNGKYLISVWADGYKLDGAHFTLPMNETNAGNHTALVAVTAQPLPLPSATIRIKVFEDNAPVNGQPDEPAENGLAGFSARLSDILGLVSTDVFGNPICTVYQHDTSGNVILDSNGKPTIQTIGGACYSDANGDVTIPNMGPNRYTAVVAPPVGQTWYQTTTLEGNIDFDTWVLEGASGYDTEMTVGSEPFPPTFFGFVKPTSLPNNPTVTGEVKGVVAAMKNYVPGVGGLAAGGTIWGGFNGSKIDKPFSHPLVALSSLTQGDQAVYVGEGDAQGAFDIKNVPDGDYTLTAWDAPISYLLDMFNVSVTNGQIVDVGVIKLSGWWSNVYGKVCNDLNHNGKCDVGEPGVPNFTIGVRRRENTFIDRGTISAITDPNGNYVLDNLYPLTNWVVEEAYNNAYRTVGVTYQTDNEPTETTILGSGVDFSVLPIIGLGGRFDWAVEPYPAGQNGGIVGTVTYDSTRNEQDPAYAVMETYQPGIPGITVNLYQPVTNPDGSYAVNPDGSYQKGALLQTYSTDTWQRPVDCTARDVNGAAINDPANPNPNVLQKALAANTGGKDCLEAPMMGQQFGRVSPGDFVPVDGNFGFSDLLPGKYLAEVVIPNDIRGKPIYKVTSEEDINVFTGDTYTPAIAPAMCVGPLHTVDVAGVGTDGYAAVSLPGGVTVPASTPVDNPGFASVGGSAYEGQQRPSCNLKLVDLKDSRSNDLNFNLFTDVPIPGKFLGYIVDDLNITTDPHHLLFGEKMGIQAPIGLYDFENRLVDTIYSDPNGVFEVLLPSTSTYNCPLPAGPCPGLYRLVGNDPGQPGHLNAGYDPAYRTISASFEVWPGMLVPADLAPTQVGVTIQSPGSQTNGPAVCKLDDATPQFFAVNKVNLANTGSSTARQVTIHGQHFGGTRGTGNVTLTNANGNSFNLTVNSWSDTQIVATVPFLLAAGPYQLQIRASNNQTLVNGVTIHVTGASYNPAIFNVGPGRTYATIQAALTAAANVNRALVVVYPGTPTLFNPKGAYYENLIMSSPVKLQGFGPGGVYTNGTYEPGSVIDGSGFGGDTTIADAWRTLAASINWVGSPLALEGADIFVAARSVNQFTSAYPAAIDGFTLTGGDQLGFPGNINTIGGGQNGTPRTNVETQGGGIYVNGYAHYLRITNNILVSNGGTFGGAIRVGTANIGSNFNDHLLISRNQVIANGGSNLAGGIGLFNGSDNYEVSYNSICGNFSAEYGGGLSAYGYSPNGSIHHNRVYFNRSYDEGGGIFIAGELPANVNTLSQGSGPVNIFNNIIQANLSNDDGGGIRFLMAGNFTFNVYNNFIANNVSTHEGGGIALDDAPNVRVYNNTIMKNITTATAMTSNGLPAPAGLSTTDNSVMLQATLPAGSPTYSKPLLFNNIFWDNRAGSWDQLQGGCILGIGMPAPCPNPTTINHWDMGVTGAAAGAVLNPDHSILQQLDLGVVNNGTDKIGVDPLVVSSFDIQVAALPFRGNTQFVGVNIVAVTLPPTLMGNYHLQNASPAVNAGINAFSSVSAPVFDIDNDPRPNGPAGDIGADELGPNGATPVVLPASLDLAVSPLTMQYMFIPMTVR